MKVYFLSDLHLEDAHSPAAQRFVEFLRQYPVRGDMVILGGDIFDLLVGDKAVFRARFAPVIEAMVFAASRGVQIFYLEGNHDFHFRSMFRGQTNIIVLAEEFPLSLPNHRLWVSHGDLIDEDDAGYRFLRAATKNKAFRGFLRAMPGRVVDWIGSHSSGASRKYTTGRVENEGTERIRRLYLEFARGKVRDGFHHVLVGHSHLRDHIKIDEGESRRGEYVNLGFSSFELPFAVLDTNSESFELRSIT